VARETITFHANAQVDQTQRGSDRLRTGNPEMGFQNTWLSAGGKRDGAAVAFIHSDTVCPRKCTSDITCPDRK